MGLAAKYFSGTIEQTLNRRVSPTAAQRDHLQTQWNRLVAYISPRLEAMHGYSVSTWLQGSYKYGTLIRPVGSRDEYDVDVGLYFSWTSGEHAPPDPLDIRDWVQRVILEFRRSSTQVKSVSVPPLPRCHRVNYTKQLHIDVPVYHLDPAIDSRKLAHLENRWEQSDAKALYIWFRGVVPARELDTLRRQIKYLKAWAALAYEGASDEEPTSVMLTVLAAEAFAQLLVLGQRPEGDDDLFSQLVLLILRRLRSDTRVENPADREENLNRLSDADCDSFIERLTNLKNICEEASSAPDESACCLAWANAFSYLMPLPVSAEIEVFDDDSGRALMQVPDILIEVYSRNPKKLVARFTNEVPGVYKNCDLHFSIVNRDLLPRYANIEWTVRNENEEAEEANDIGHSQAGMSLHHVKESTSYVGRHFMDCVIRANGNVYAVRRVPVEILDITRPTRAAPRNAPYRKLSTRRGRR